MISRTHPIARRLRLLRRDREARDREGILVGEGPHLAEEALRSGARILLAVSSPRLTASAEGRGLVERLAGAGVPVHEASEGTLELLTEARSPQPVLVLVERRRSSLEEMTDGIAPPLVVAVCGVQDPGNLGAIVRVADAAGASGIVATPGTADFFHPRAVRASAGAIFRLPVREVGTEGLETLLRSSRAGLVAADPREGTRYDAFDWTRPAVLALGAEGSGLPEACAALVTARVVVPMRSPAESLSVATAAAVLLFEAARQRVSSGG